MSENSGAGYWHIPRDRLDIDKFLEVAGYNIVNDNDLGKRTVHLQDETFIGYLDTTEEGVSFLINYSVESYSAVESQLEFRKLLESNSLRYREVPDRDAAASRLREKAEKLQSLASILQSN